MKKIGLFIFFLLVSRICSAQQIVSKGHNVDSLYAIVFDHLNKQKSLDQFPTVFSVNDTALDYVAEFLSEQSTSPIKALAATTDWNFISKIDTAKSYQGERRKQMEVLKPLLKFQLVTKKNLNYTYSFSPVIFANDHRKAFLICQKNTGIEISGITCYFFKKTAGTWVLLKTQDPYLI